MISTLSRRLVFSLVLVCVGFLAWRSQFGVELYDEPLYLAGSFKLYSMGETPFRDELHNSLRQYDLLNHFFVRPFLPFSVLTLRRAAVFLYSALLCALGFVLYRGVPKPLVLLGIAGCLLYDPFLMPTWSHNWWARNLLLTHAIFLVLAPRRDLHALFSGLSLGLCAIAYNPLIVALGAGVLGIGFFGFGLSAKARGLYVLGALLAPVVGLSALKISGLQEDWLSAVSAMFVDYSSGDKISGSKPVLILSYLFRCRELWIVAGVSFLCGLQRLRLFSFFILSLAVAYLIRRFWSADQFFTVSSTLVGLGVGGALSLVLQSSAPLLFRYLGAVVLLSSAAMALSSHNAHLSLFWALPVVVLLYLHHLEQTAKIVWRLPALLLTVFLVCGALYHQLYAESFDVSLFESTTEIHSPPYEGIRTSPRRAYLIEELADQLKDEEYVLSLGIPGAFMLSQVKPAGNTVLLHPRFPSELGESTLRHAIAEQKIPSLVVLEKDEVWSWGLTPRVSDYSPANPVIAFATCAFSKMQLDLPELKIIRLAPDRIGECILKRDFKKLAFQTVSSASGAGPIP